MAFNVFTNAEDVPKVPDAILGPGGQIFTNYDLSADASTPDNLPNQVPTVKAYQINGELPLYGTPKFGDFSYFSGRGFYRPSDSNPFGTPVLPSDPISSKNADFLSTQQANYVFNTQVLKIGQDNPITSQLLAEHRISADTIRTANLQTGPKIQALVDQYRALQKKEATGNLIDSLGVALVGLVAAIFAPPIAAAGYGATAGGLSLGQRGVTGQKVTGADIALAEGPAAVAFGAPFLMPGPLSDAEAAKVAAATGKGAIALSDPLIAEEFPAFASALGKTSTIGGAVAETAETAAKYGPAVAAQGPGFFSDLLSGKIGSALSDVGRFFGLPLPHQPGDTPGAALIANQPQNSPAGSLGGGSSTVDLLPASPYDKNTSQWVIGAAIVLVAVFLIFRKR